MKRVPAKKRPKKRAEATKGPHIHFRRAIALEDQDPAGARAAYVECLRGDCSHLEARINLGRLLHLQGELEEAESVYRALHHPSGVLYFNIGVLMEDLQREILAVAAYREAILHRGWRTHTLIYLESTSAWAKPRPPSGTCSPSDACQRLPSERGTLPACR